MTNQDPIPQFTDPRRKRLYYQCWHRGMREMDMILGSFANQHLASLTDAQLEVLEALLSVPDQLFYRWVTGAEEVPAEYQSSVYSLVADVSRLPELWANNGAPSHS